jgi:hypothetical protein
VGFPDLVQRFRVQGSKVRGTYPYFGCERVIRNSAVSIKKLDINSYLG